LAASGQILTPARRKGNVSVPNTPEINHAAAVLAAAEARSPKEWNKMTPSE
jgi:hypothetical protein